MRKNKLSDMEVRSVDLCKRGANQRADIKLYKSAPEGDEQEMERITKSAGVEQVQGTTYTLCKSLESIIEDDSLTAVEKQNMMEESMQQFSDHVTGLMEGWAQAVGKADADDEEPEEEPEDDEGTDEGEAEEYEDEDGGELEDEPESGPAVRKSAKRGVFDMATIDINKMSPEDKATLEALEKKYSGEPQTEIHPEVRKALDEVAEMRKSMELEKLEGVAKKYEIIGKKAPELAQKLYDLKKAGEQHYNDYVALLDEQVAMASNGIFKEYGSSRTASDLNATVADIIKANPGLTREQAIVKAYESNPALDPFTGRVK